MTLFVFLAQLFLGAVFVVSAVPKIANPRLFIFNVENYKLLPGPLAKAYGWTLPYVELATGVALVLGVQTKLASPVALLMLGSFVIAMVTAIARKQHVECTCFGLLYREKVGWSTVLRDAVLAALAVAVWLLPPWSPVGEALTGEVSGTGVATLALSVAVIAGSAVLGYKTRTVIRRGVS